MGKKIIGNLSGLKASQIKDMEDLFHFRTPPEFLITEQQILELTSISHEIKRQIGLLIDRNGKTSHVIAGDAHRIVIPVTPDHMALPGKLKGLRCIHTHLKNEPLTRDDLTDLALLRLDYMAAVSIDDNGYPLKIYSSHILPAAQGNPHAILKPFFINDLNIDCLNQIHSIENELSSKSTLYKADKGVEKALLINVTTENSKNALASLEELKELCKTSKINVINSVVQRRKKIDSKFVVGKGKLTDITIKAIQQYATMLIFDQELTPSQIRSITNFVEMKVIDRTQLILDIFAKQAKSHEGKLQVELAQMQYLLPRLATKNTAMSRLTGGIGGRGPGETKLEINRRRVRDKITKLKKDIKKIRSQRSQQRAKRQKHNLPVISIVGYTNAGKSTLLNSLTKSKILVANKLFATLDPSSRKLRFPKDTEAIITDTVGFIQNLPKELMEAFHATLEELEHANVILHVIDISNPRYKQQMQSVEEILNKLELATTPVINVFNKMDKIVLKDLNNTWELNQGILISATQKKSLTALVSKLESVIEKVSIKTKNNNKF